MSTGINNPSSPSNSREADAARITDTDLIEQAQSGDQDAFRQLVERHENAVAATAIGMLGEGQEAEDVGQETFVRFFRNIHRFRGDAQLGTYLTRIAINLSLDALRRRKRNRFRFWINDQPESLPDELVVQADDIAEKEERRLLVRGAVQSLDPKHRAVVVLRMLKGYSTKETAEALKIPLGTVLSRLSRAEDKLRKILKPVLSEFYNEEPE